MMPGLPAGLLLWRKDDWMNLAERPSTAHAAEPSELIATVPVDLPDWRRGQLAEPQSCQVFRIVPIDARALEAVEQSEDGQAFTTGKSCLGVFPPLRAALKRSAAARWM